ncbi:MAG: radical SAM protein [Thermoleophilia bacterium]
MNSYQITKLAAKHGRNALGELLYVRFGRDITRPVFFYALTTYRCNARCLSCSSWKEPMRSEELSIDEWQRSLLSLKDFVGEFSISFSGGEPLIKKGFIKLLEFCRDNGIHAGFTTNGMSLTKSVAKRIAAAQPFNVNISVDGPSAEMHDYLRGRTGVFDKVSQGIAYLQEERAELGSHFPITVKPTVNAVNFQQMPALVNWAIKVGVTAVNFQPVDDWNWAQETRELLWIKPADFPKLGSVVDQLIDMKNEGAPILNSGQSLRLIIPHFRGDKASIKALPCRVGLSYFYIDPMGDVKICPKFPSVGNLRNTHAREIWYGAESVNARKQTINCQELCLLTCVTNKSLKERLKMGRKLFTENRKSRPGASVQ